MARPVTITNERILDAARELFLEKGVSVTTAEVARRAGIAEGSIFKRFKTKEDLFCAAMTPNGAPGWVLSLPKRAEQPDVKKQLVELGVEMIDFFRKMLPLMIMSWSNQGTFATPEPLRGPNPPPVRAVRALTTLFEAYVRAGTIARGVEPEIAARVFLGSIQNYVFFELLAQREGAPPMPDEREYLRRLIEMLWRGLAPAETPKRPRQGARRKRS